MNEPPDQDADLSPLALVVLELLKLPDAKRLARLQALEIEQPEMALHARRRLRVLDQHDLLPRLETETEPAQEPRQIAGYRILRRLGSGGMGVVWLAEQPALQRTVALKVLHEAALASERARERFRREALAAARLDHPSLCPVHEVGEIDGVPFLAMRYVPGQTLGALIETARGVADAAVAKPGDRRQDVLAAVELVERIARAIHCAHIAGLVHRDLKPDNIIVEPDGTPVVLDFGLAQDTSTEGRLTLSGDRVGTPVYMAPEQIAGRGKRLDARTDVYALGAVLYECLTLELPVQAADRESLYRAITSGRGAEAARAAATLDRDLRVILAVAMAPEPARRYASALTLAEDLARYRARLPILARPAGAWLRVRRWTQRNPVLAASFAALSLGLLASLVLLYQRGLALGERDVALSQRDVALDRARSVELSHQSREVQGQNTMRAHLLALGAVGIERNLETISQLHATTADVRECAEIVHPGAVWRGEFSPDGQRVVTCSDRGVAKLWRIDGTLLATLQHEGHHVSVALFAADGRIVTADRSGHAKLWNASGGYVRGLLDEHNRDEVYYGVLAGALHRDSGALLLTGDKGLCYWWRSLDGQPEELAVTKGRLLTCAISEDGQWFGVAVNDYGMPSSGNVFSAWIWNVHTASPVELCGHTASITGIAFVAGGVWTTSEDSTMALWSLDGVRQRSVTLPTMIRCLAVSADGQRLATGAFDGEVRIWSAAGEELGRAPRQGTWIHALRFSPDGTRILTAGEDGTARILDARGIELERFVGHEAQVRSCAWSPDAKLVVTTSHDKTARLWRTHGSLPRFLGHRHAVRCLGVSADGQWLASGSFDGTARIWRIADGTALKEIPALRGANPGYSRLTGIAFHPRLPAEVLLCTWDQAAQRVDFVTEERQPPYLPGDGLRSCCGAYSPDGRWLVLAGRWGHGAVLRIDLVTGEQRVIPTTPRDETMAIAFASDSLRFATGGMAPGGRKEEITIVGVDGTVRQRWRCIGHTDWVGGLAFSPDGKFLLSGSHDRTARVWDLAQDPPAEVARLEGHDAVVTAVAWSPDGRTLATASMDKTARLWSVTGKPLVVLRGHGGVVWDLKFANDSARLFTASDDCTIRTWLVETEGMIGLAEKLAFRGLKLAERSQHENVLRR